MDQPFKTSLTSWDQVILHANELCQRNWTWGGLRQSLCHDCCKMNRSSIAWKSAGNFNNSFKRIQTFFWRLSLAPSNYFSSPRLKSSWRGKNLIQLRKFKWKHRQYYTPWQRNTSRIQFKIGKNAGICVFAPKGTTFKVIVQNRIQLRHNSFY
jgi:hypothetical protein